MSPYTQGWKQNQSTYQDFIDSGVITEYRPNHETRNAILLSIGVVVLFYGIRLLQDYLGII